MVEAVCLHYHAPLETMSAPHHPFASPNAIPPRTSSNGILNANTNSLQHRSSVLRPLSEIDWLGQSKKTKTSHPQPLDPGLDSPVMQSPNGKPSQSSSPVETSPTHAAPADSIKTAGESLVYGNGAAWAQEKERILLGPYDYLYGHPGKDIRSQCIAAFNLWLHVPPERLVTITRVVGMLHTASLL